MKRHEFADYYFSASPRSIKHPSLSRSHNSAKFRNRVTHAPWKRENVRQYFTLILICFKNQTYVGKLIILSLMDIHTSSFDNQTKILLPLNWLYFKLFLLSKQPINPRIIFQSSLFFVEKKTCYRQFQLAYCFYAPYFLFQFHLSHPHWYQTVGVNCSFSWFALQRHIYSLLYAKWFELYSVSNTLGIPRVFKISYSLVQFLILISYVFLSWKGTPKYLHVLLFICKGDTFIYQHLSYRFYWAKMKLVEPFFHFPSHSVFQLVHLLLSYPYFCWKHFNCKYILKTSGYSFVSTHTKIDDFFCFLSMYKAQKAIEFIISETYQWVQDID